MPEVYAIVGPTGVGKSEIAVSLASKIDAEIVSVDSVQIYKHFDAGTAKPALEYRRRVPHFMIDVLEPSEETSAGWYRTEAAKALAEILERGHSVVLVGGSALYYFALTTDLPLYPVDSDIRQQVRRLIQDNGLEYAQALLGGLAPELAEKVDVKNPRRLGRALEIALSAKVSSRSVAGSFLGIEHYIENGRPLVGIGIDMPAPIYKERIRERTLGMFRAGLVDEVHRWLMRNEDISVSLANAVGYKQVREYLNQGKDPTDAFGAVVAATHRLARRQRGWFRRDPRVTWFFSGDLQELEGAIFQFARSRRRPRDTGAVWLEWARRFLAEYEEPSARSA
jgi:tRNA dimethylallyltransferase